MDSVANAFFGVFPHGFTVLSEASSDLLFVGAKKPIRLKAEGFRQAWEREGVRLRLELLGLRQPEEVLAFYALTREQQLRGASTAAENTDDRLMTEVRVADAWSPSLGTEYAGRRTMDTSAILEDQEAGEVLRSAGQAFLGREWVEGMRLVERELSRRGHKRLARDLGQQASQLASELQQHKGEADG